MAATTVNGITYDRVYENGAWKWTLPNSGKSFSSSDEAENYLKTLSATELANFAKTNGIQGLQNYTWWSENPNKTAAWNIVQGNTSNTTTNNNTSTGNTLPTGIKSAYFKEINGIPIYFYEKSDGTGIRAGVLAKDGTVNYIGRTNEAEVTSWLKDNTSLATQWMNASTASSPANVGGVKIVYDKTAPAQSGETWQTVTGVDGLKYQKSSNGQFKIDGLSTTFPTYEDLRLAVKEASSQDLANIYVGQGKPANVQNMDWWKSNPNREDAYSIVITGGATGGTTTDTTGAANQVGQLTDYIKNKNTGEITFVGGMTPAEKLDLIREWGGPTNAESSTSEAYNTYLDIAQSELWQEFSKAQQYLFENPDAYKKLVQDVQSNIFQSSLDEAMGFLNKQKEITVKNANDGYNEAIAKINLNEQLNEQQKSEQVKQVTSSYIETMRDLNLSEEAAYLNASTQLEKLSNEAGNAAATTYLNTITAGMTGGNIAQLNAKAITTALKQNQKSIVAQHAITQQQIESNRQKSFTQLEQQVGREKALEVWDQIQKDEAQLTTENFNQQKLLQDTKQMNALDANLNGVQMPKTQDFKGAINQAYEANKASANLSRTSAANTLTTNLQQANLTQESKASQEKKQTAEATQQYLTNNIGNVYYKKNADGSFSFNVKQTGDASTYNQRLSKLQKRSFSPLNQVY